MGNWYVKIKEKPRCVSINSDGETDWLVEMGDLRMSFAVTPPDKLMYLDLDEYKKAVQEEYKEMVLAILGMSFAELGVCFGSSHYTCLRKILEDHPDPLGAYQRWKAKKDSAKEMTIEEIEAQLGYKIKVVGKEDK